MRESFSLPNEVAPFDYLFSFSTTRSFAPFLSTAAIIPCDLFSDWFDLYRASSAAFCLRGIYVIRLISSNAKTLGMLFGWMDRYLSVWWH